MKSRRSLPKIPESVTVITGDEAEALATAEDFFRNVLKFLGYPEKAIGRFTEVDDRVLVYPSWVAAGNHESDDFMKMLIAKNMLVATMIARRNISNNVEYSFAHYLSEDVIRRTQWEP